MWGDSLNLADFKIKYKGRKQFYFRLMETFVTLIRIGVNLDFWGWTGSLFYPYSNFFLNILYKIVQRRK